ncbi:MAG: hypothetical protein PHP26_04120 [Syntrophomonas sp.]|uniref:hypothetical protein n=1 Tax=Syntrophomonas sp. TaxID=2053627 RepID=UPI00260257BE|nr:hypothetical protein [Syntrophomonas sp.]MDD2510186.1 hypothetical protein [Syntrophomonas sp.]MDD3879162.1 hypothetical protein [Syntrophomonas sp.]MDD4625793.1 hypothetical protein [Syntrophomonas sp.]
MKTMTAFEKQLQIEKQNRIAKTHCKLCKHLIGNKPHIVFEERYFHSVCLKKKTNIALDR